MIKRRDPKSILITGATSGIGKALAKRYAKAGVSLFLSGRNAKRLNETIGQCDDLGAHTIGRIVNVENESAMRDWVHQSHAVAPLDLVIANAGISTGTQNDANFKKTLDIFMINLIGVLNTIHPAIQAMRRNNGGQIALMSSMAGYRGLPNAPAYSASKSALKAYGEALRGQLAPENIDVNVICPGFVKSAITQKNNFTMPFLMETPKAVDIIKAGLNKNKALIAFPWQMRAIGYFLSMLPTEFAIKLLAKLPNKS